MKSAMLIVSSPFEIQDLAIQFKNQMWRAFMRGEVSTHTCRAATLPYLIRRAEQEKEPYILTAVPGEGYSLVRAMGHVANR